MAATSSVLPSGPIDVPEAQITRDDVAALAHRLWQDRGCPDGSPETDWYEAERQLEASSATNS
jgi:DUF2934 family protein